MTALMIPARGVGLVGRLPPQEIVSKSLARTGLHDDVRAPARRGLGFLAHFAFGVAGGALFGLLRRGGLPGPGPLTGIGFGLLVWLTAYLGWVPGLRLLPAATDDQPGRPTTMISAHVVYGAVLGAVADRLARR